MATLRAHHTREISRLHNHSHSTVTARCYGSRFSSVSPERWGTRRGTTKASSPSTQVSGSRASQTASGGVVGTCIAITICRFNLPNHFTFTCHPCSPICSVADRDRHAPTTMTPTWLPRCPQGCTGWGMRETTALLSFRLTPHTTHHCRRNPGLKLTMEQAGMDLVCSQRPAAKSAIKIGCIGDSVRSLVARVMSSPSSLTSIPLPHRTPTPSASHHLAGGGR